MPAYYAIGYLSRVLFRVTTVGEQPHAKTPNAGPQAPPIAKATKERRLLAVACRPMLGWERFTDDRQRLGSQDSAWRTS